MFKWSNSEIDLLACDAVHIHTIEFASHTLDGFSPIHQWMQISNTMDAHTMISNLKRQKQTIYSIQAMKFWIWFLVSVPFYRRRADKFGQTNRQEAKGEKNRFDCYVNCSIFFSIAHCMYIGFRLDNINTNGHVHTRTCKYLQFIWQLTWISMRYND